MTRKRKTVYYCTGCSKVINYPNVIDVDGKSVPMCPECEIKVKKYEKISK